MEEFTIQSGAGISLWKFTGNVPCEWTVFSFPAREHFPGMFPVNERYFDFIPGAGTFPENVPCEWTVFWFHSRGNIPRELWNFGTIPKCNSIYCVVVDDLNPELAKSELNLSAPNCNQRWHHTKMIVIIVILFIIIILIKTRVHVGPGEARNRLLCVHEWDLSAQRETVRLGVKKSWRVYRRGFSWLNCFNTRRALASDMKIIAELSPPAGLSKFSSA